MRIVSDSEVFRHLVGRRIESVYESDMPMVGVGLDDGTTIIVSGTEGCGGGARLVTSVRPSPALSGR